MFCSKCGRDLPNGTRFCDKCGTALPVAQSLQPVSPVRSPVHYSLAPTVLDMDKPSVSALKGLIRSPLAVVAGLVLLLQLILRVVFMLGSADSIFDLLRVLDIPVTASVENSFSLAVGISAMLPGLMILALSICIGCACVRKGMHRVGTIAVKVLCYISLVLTTLLFAAMIVTQLMGETGVFADVLLLCEIGITDLETANTVSMILTVLLAAFVIFLHIRAINMLGAAGQIARTGKTTKKASVTLAIVCILYGLLYAFAALVLFSSRVIADEFAFPDQFHEMAQNLAWPALLSALAGLLFGMLIFEYRAKVQPLALIPKESKPTPAVPVQQDAVQEEPKTEEELIQS